MTLPISNATRMADAVAAVASEVARTGIVVASIAADDYSASIYGGTPRGLTVRVQARTGDDTRALAHLFVGLPVHPLLYGDERAPSVIYRGAWTGMGVQVEVYGPARVEVSA